MTTFKCYLRWDLFVGVQRQIKAWTVLIAPDGLQSDWSFSVPVPILFLDVSRRLNLQLSQTCQDSGQILITFEWNHISKTASCHRPCLTNAGASFFIGNLLNLCDVTWHAQMFQAQKSQASGNSFQETKLDWLVHIPVEWCTSWRGVLKIALSYYRGRAKSGSILIHTDTW